MSLSQFASEEDLNKIKGLLHYMNESFGLPENAKMSAEIKLTDSNGDILGVVDYNDPLERYVFYYVA